MLTVLLTNGEQADFPRASWVRIDPRAAAFFRYICYRSDGDGSGDGEVARLRVEHVKAYVLNGTRFTLKRGTPGGA